MQSTLTINNEHITNISKVRLLEDISKPVQKSSTKLHLLQPNQAGKGSRVNYVSLPNHLATETYHALAVALLDDNALSWAKRHLPGIPVALR